MEKTGYSASDLPKWGSVTVYGLDADDIKSTLSVDGQDLQDKASYDEDTKVSQLTLFSSWSLFESHAGSNWLLLVTWKLLLKVFRMQKQLDLLSIIKYLR